MIQMTLIPSWNSVIIGTFFQWMSLIREYVYKDCAGRSLWEEVRSSNKCIHGWVSGCRNGWMDECLQGWKGGWMDGRVDEWTDGWTAERQVGR